MPPSHLFSASLVITRPVITIAVSVKAEQAAIALALRALAARGSLSLNVLIRRRISLKAKSNSQECQRKLLRLSKQQQPRAMALQTRSNRWPQQQCDSPRDI
jgi:hypothetical protein